MHDVLTAPLAILAAGKLDPAQITQLLLALAALLGLARLLGEAARALKQPPILGEILAGVLLGPTVLGMIAPGVQSYLFPDAGPVAYALEALITLSVILLLLIAGLEVELSTVWRQGKRAVSVAAMSMIIPFVIGFGIAWVLPNWIGYKAGGETDHGLLPFALFIGIALSITALPVIAKILMDMGLAKSEMGTVVISAAMLNDLIGWIGFAMVLAMIATDPAAPGPAGPNAAGIGMTIGLTLLYIGLVMTAGYWAFNRLIPLIQAHSSWPGGMLGFVIVMAILGAAFTEHIGIHSIFGAFIIGIAIGNSRHLREKVRHTVHDFVGNIFAPLFFASIGLSVNFVESFNLPLVLFVLVIAIIAKLVGGYVGARITGMERRTSGAIGVAMCARGAMEIILGQLALQAGLIDKELFVAIVVMAIVTSLISGPGIEKLLARAKPKTLRDYLSNKQVAFELRATDRRAAIHELARLAAGVSELDADHIADAAWQREQIVPTGIGSGIAVPHARLADLDRTVVILGRSEAGIDFDSPQGERARIICLILTPGHDEGAQLEALAAISHALADPATRAAILNAGNYTDLLAALNTAQPPHATP